MAETTLTKKDLRDAENFLTQFQAEQVPEANLQPGGAVRDFLIKGFAAMYAFLRGEADSITAKQSLLRLQEELEANGDSEDISQAVDEILSNWFIRRKGGKYAYVTARMHFLRNRAQSIPLSTRFWRTNRAVFYLDATTDPFVISEAQMLPIYDTTGELVDYVVDVPLKAASVGEGYDIDPGNFVRIQLAGGLPYFSYAENLEASSGGRGVETTSELLERAETAISVRNLINNRSCDAVLQEEFPEIDDTLTIGMGEPEMIRDLRTEIAKHIKLHIGGHYDTYVGLDLTTIEENLTVGGYFYRPDNVVNVFRDPGLTHDEGRTFTSLGVQPGHVIYVRDGIIGSPRGYPITYVSDHELHVSAGFRFTQASDELSTNAVLYSIGWYAPDFEEVDFGGVFQRVAVSSAIPGKENIPYGTSRRIMQPGSVVLSGKPVQDIAWVEITNPPASLSEFIDLATETIIFHTRINVPPQVHQAEPSYSQYGMRTLNPANGQSLKALNLLSVGFEDDPDPAYPVNIFDGLNLRIVYQTLAGISNIHDYVENRNHRVACANQLIKARHPIWVTANIEYRLKPTVSGELNEKEASKFIADHINSFDPNDDLDVSDLNAAFRQEYSNIVGTVYPLTVYYHLDAPDGQQAFFSTTDIISIFEGSDRGVVLENGDEIESPPNLQERGIPTIQSAQQLADWFLYLGISDRTVTYRSREELITFTIRG
jgi:hypothetical protein